MCVLGCGLAYAFYTLFSAFISHSVPRTPTSLCFSLLELQVSMHDVRSEIDLQLVFNFYNATRQAYQVQSDQRPRHHPFGRCSSWGDTRLWPGGKLSLGELQDTGRGEQAAHYYATVYYYATVVF